MNGKDGDARLGELRRRMDTITEEMTRLLLERGDIASEIGRIKGMTGRQITDEGREAQLRQKIIRMCGPDEACGTSEISGESESTKMVSRFLNFLLSESTRRQTAVVSATTAATAAASQAQHAESACCSTPTHLSVFARAKELERSGRKIIHMEVGEPDFAPQRTVRDALAASYDTGRTRYGGSHGELELREALAAHASERFAVADATPENIIITPGGRFAVFAAVTTLLSPGDESIIIEPAWPAYRDCIMHAGARVRAIQTTLDDAWTPDVERIRQAVNHGTKMIILNYPNNPTGRVLPQDVMDEIMELASRHDMYVLSDEIYADYTTKPWRSAAAYGYDKAIAVQSFSKSHAMTGLRVGYAVAHPDVIGRIASLAALCLTSVCAPAQYAALKSVGDDTSRNAGVIAGRLRALEQPVREMGFEFAPPDGGMYIFAHLPGHAGMDGVEISRRMLEEHGVALAPGAGFGPYPQYVRISAAGADSDRLNEGINRLKGMLMTSQRQQETGEQWQERRD